MIHLRRFRQAVILLSAALLFGCASHEALTSYYVLTANTSAGAGHGTPAAVHGPRVFIRRVDIPGYLQTTKLTSRHAANQIVYATGAQWAEPLDQGIADALSAAMNATGRVTVVGVVGGGVPPVREYDLKIDVERCEGDDQGNVVLAATWMLFAPESSTPILTRRSRYVQTGWKFGDYPGLAKLLGLDVANLAGEIARSVRS